MSKRPANRFVKKCMNGVMTRIINIVSKEGGETVSEKRDAPATKSS